MTKSTEITSTENKSQNKDKKTSNNQYKLFILLFIILIITTTGILFHIKNTENSQNKKFQQSIEELRSQQAHNTEVELKKITNLSQSLDIKITKIKKKISKSLEDTAYKSNDWIMQKAKYYLELAIINNNWTDDSNTTQKLLMAADNTLKDIPKDEVTEVRKLIAEEELRVSSINKLDKIKILSEIHAINKYLQEQPIIPLKNRIKPVKTSQNINNISSINWQDTFKNNLKKLNSLIIIRHNNANSTKLFSPSYLTAVRETIKLNLQQMQWAILERNQDIYNLSCQQAIDNIDYSLDDENPQKKAILNKLKNLQKIDLTLTKTKIGKSLIKLNKIINTEKQEFLKNRNSI